MNLDFRFMKNWKRGLIKLVRPELEKLDVGHGIEHSLRVYKNCEKIAKYYQKVNLDALYASALLHDIGQTVKHFDEHSYNSIILAKKYLKNVQFPEKNIFLVEEIIKRHDDYTWVKKHSNNKPKNLEVRIFQDADRLETIGAIGIARNFIWAGKHDKKSWDNKKRWKRDKIFGGNISVIHTIDAELQIYKNLNTKVAKKMAKEKHEFYKLFLKQFFKEWKQ